MFSLPPRSDFSSEGICDEDELEKIMQLHYYATFNDIEIVTKGKLQETQNDSLRRIQACLASIVRSIGKSGLIADVVGRLQKHQTLTDYGVEVIQRLLHMKGSLGVDAIAAKHMITAAAALITQQRQTFVECLDYYLSEEGGSVHLPEIYRLAHMSTAEADEKFERYILEGSQLACSLSLSRKVDFAQNIRDNGESMELIPSQRGHLRYAISLPGPEGRP